MHNLIIADLNEETEREKKGRCGAMRKSVCERERDGIDCTAKHILLTM